MTRESYCPHCYAFNDPSNDPKGELRNARVTHFAVRGLLHTAPEMWIVGRSYARKRDGSSTLDAIRLAYHDWATQCEMMETE